MTRTATRFIAGIVLAGLAGIPGEARDIVQFRSSSRLYTAPATVRLTVAVAQDPQNRKLRIEAESGQFFRASEVPLVGELEKRLHSIELKSLPAGEYVVRAEVSSNSGVRGTAVHTFEVVGAESPERGSGW